jgi:Formyl transferase
VEGKLKIEWRISKDKAIVAIDKQKGIVLWCGDAANQKALAVKIAKRFTLSGIVIDERSGVRAKKKFSRLPFLIWDRLRFKSIYDSWEKLQQYYGQIFSSWPDVPVLRVPDINNDETAEFTKKFQPALIAVSGTALVKEKLLSTGASIGIINLHTGLSPYVKGGPNCTNWCIANNDWHLAGNTIMWLNAGIDSGNIITSETVDISDSPNLFEVQKKVMEHAHDLYLRAIEYLLNNEPPYNSVPQHSLGKGRLFLTKMWSAAERKNLLKNWRNRKDQQQMKAPVTIQLTGSGNKFQSS